jgi:hypothetical protein
MQVCFKDILGQNLLRRKVRDGLMTQDCLSQKAITAMAQVGPHRAHAIWWVLPTKCWFCRHAGYNNNGALEVSTEISKESLGGQALWGSLSPCKQQLVGWYVELWEWKWGFAREFKKLEMPGTRSACWRKLQAVCRASPKERRPQVWKLHSHSGGATKPLGTFISSSVFQMRHTKV